jgi:MFS family permease
MQTAARDIQAVTELHTGVDFENASLLVNQDGSAADLRKCIELTRKVATPRQGCCARYGTQLWERRVQGREVLAVIRPALDPSFQTDQHPAAQRGRSIPPKATRDQKLLIVGFASKLPRGEIGVVGHESLIEPRSDALLAGIRKGQGKVLQHKWPKDGGGSNQVRASRGHQQSRTVGMQHTGDRIERFSPTLRKYCSFMKAGDGGLNHRPVGVHLQYLVVGPMQDKNTRIAIFLGIGWLYACIHLDRQILAILAESVKSDLHLQDRQLGVLTGSAFSIVYALLGLYFGGLADRSDRLMLVRAGAWIWSLSCLVAAFAPGYSILIASRAGVAVGEAVATAAAVAAIADLAGERYRALAASFFLTSAFVGAGVAAIAGGAIVDRFRSSPSIAGWRAALVAAGLPGIAGALYLRALGKGATVAPPLGERAQPSTALARSHLGVALPLMLVSLSAVVLQMRAPAIWSVPLCLLTALGIACWWVSRLRRDDLPAYLATLGQKPFRYLIAAFAAVMFADYAAAFWLIPYAQRQFGLSAGTAGAQLGGLMIGGGILGCLLAGYAADYWRSFRVSGRVWTALLVVMAEGAAILWSLEVNQYHDFLTAFGTFCIASGGWAGLAAAIAFDLVPSAYRGTGTASYFLFTTLLGPGLGPFAVGLCSDMFDSARTALAASCAVFPLAAVALIQLGVVLERGHSQTGVAGAEPRS